MGRLRTAAQKAVEHRKCENDPRMSYLQTVLHSVNIRKTPTLEELLKESDIHTQASSDTISGSMSQNILSRSFKPAERIKETLHPLTSTTCSALLTSHVQPQTSYSENSHNFHQASQSGSNSCSPNAFCHPSLSSGFDSCVNVEHTISATENHKVGNLFLENGRGSVEDFFDHNSSDTVKNMPDIINYPPVDGEELEKSEHKSPFVIDLKAENPESVPFVEHISAEESYDVFPEHKEATHLASQTDGLQDAEVKSGLKDQPKDAPASNCLTQIHLQLFDKMQTDEEDSNPPEEPHRMSLQTLLKKSQEYRRHQRMFRSQAKNAKIQDRAQDQPKSEEQSLSDKENDEWHSKGTQLKKCQDRNDTLSPTVNQSMKKSYENDEKSEEITDKSHLTIDSQAQDSIIMSNSDSYDSIKMNNWVNTSGPRNVPLLAPIWTKNLNKSSGRSASTSPTAFKDVRKYHKIPALNFCRSPVSCKVKRSSPPYDNISQTEAVINKSVNKEHKVEQSSSSPSPLNVVVESDVTSVLARSSQHIDQLEFNLSGLKVLISDLESTLTENVDKSSSQSESLQTQLSQSNLAGWFGDVRHSQKSQSLDSIKSGDEKTSQIERTTKAINPQEKQLVTTIITNREVGQARLTDAQNTRRLSSAKCILSTAQRMLIPDVFRNCLPEAATQISVSSLSDTSKRLVMEIDSDVGQDSRSTSLNQSYDVEAPSELWLQRACDPQRCEKNELTPEYTGEGQGMGSKVKRRLQMPEDVQEKVSNQENSLSRPNSSTPKAAARRHEGLDSVMERQEQLKQIHTAQIRALQEEHRRQQEQLLQTLAARYHVLHSVSLPYSMSTSRLGDAVTFPTLSQQPSPSPLPEHYRHLLSAAAKGFLTRRLLKTERVAQLVRTVRDTQQFLKVFQQQNPNKGLCSRHDLLLLERVTLQLRATRYEIYDIFFSLSAEERMQLISMDRDLARERELRRQNGAGGQPKGKCSLSAATQKSLERKRGLIIQKKTAERHRGAGMRTRHKPRICTEQPLETRAGQFRANPQRVPKSTYTSRPR